MIELSKEQQKVHDSVIDWYRNRNNDFIAVAGLAGTGKTTVIGFIAQTIKENSPYPINIAYATYTGKASLVLRSKLKGIGFSDYVGTIHSLIYKPIVVNDVVVGWSKKASLDHDLIIIDEGSMVGKEIWEDLLHFRTPIIVVGDHGQLPPVGENNFSLMKEPDLKLETIHRQALENPIIKLSMIARKYGKIPTRIFGKNAAKLDWVETPAREAINKFDINDDVQILCGMNKTRVKLNQFIRGQLGFERKEPYTTERLICLLNNKDDYVMNGQMGIVKNIKLYSDKLYEIEINLTGFGTRNLIVYKGGFNKEKYDAAIKDSQDKRVKSECLTGSRINLFDFGYCISVHKSQGSEWDKVVLIEERNFYQSDEDYSRWLYTGITRAKNKLLIIDNYY